MSIAKKLVTIAENEQRVYEAGSAYISTILRETIERKADYTIPFTFPKGITNIGQCAFYCHQNMVFPMEFPEGLESIEYRAFYRCDGLAGELVLPSSLSFLDGGAFTTCKNLTSVTFKGIPTTIESNAFNQCSALITINVPWAEGAVANAPWGATKATINYNYTEG